MATLIVGCGDAGVRVAARAVAAGERTFGVVRSKAAAVRVRSVGAEALRIDLDEAINNLPCCDRLIYCAPPPRSGQDDERIARVLSALSAIPQRVVYISTSGVYGDCGGDWVDETRRLAPVTDRAVRRVAAERRLRAWADHAIVLRTPGVYGPGRLPIDRVLSGEPVLNDQAGGWVNRIHIDDLAAMIWSAASTSWPRTIYNACDGKPTPQAVYYDALAALLGVARPPRISWAEAEQRFSAQRLSFLRESRRLSNARLLADTGFRFSFADYREGLVAALRGDTRFSPSY